MTRISVAIATYNGAKFLAQQLESIAAQTTSPCEVVLCDDGSADHTLQVIDRFARVARFPVRAVRNDVRLNYRANFMKAAQSCSGDLIAFCDQDDIWRADKLSVVAGTFTDPDVLLVRHNARVFSEASGVTGQLYSELRPSRVDGPLCRTPFDMAPGFTQVFRRWLLLLSELREATVDLWGPGAALAHDQWTYILASSLGKVSYLKETLVDYRQHDNNLYGMRSAKRTRWNAMKARLTSLIDYGHLETAFGAIARALGAAAAYPIGEEFARRAAVAAERYREIAQAYGDRSQAHGGASLMARAAAWQRLWRRGRYRPGGNFYFAGGAGARDLVHGVCLARLRHPPAGLLTFDPALTLAPAC
jgi:glycosyltransferase involved in cell wall biosynthesis